MKTTYQHQNLVFSFTDEDTVNLDDWIPSGEYNPHRIRPWLIHDHGFTLGVVFAENVERALEILAYSGKIDGHLLDSPTEADWEQYEKQERYVSIGGAGELFDLDSVEVVELPNPRSSFVAQFAACFPPPKNP